MTEAQGLLKQNESFAKKIKNESRWALAYLTDWFLWTYSILVCWKIIYVKLILHVRYPVFSWEDPRTAAYWGVALALLTFFTPLSIGRVVLGLAKRPERNFPLLKKPHFWISSLIILLTFLAGLVVSRVDFSRIFDQGGRDGAQRIFTSILNPTLNPIILQDAIIAAIETIYMAFIATAFAIPLAFLLAFFAARNLTRSNTITKSVYTLTRFFLNITRSIEPIVWAIIFSVWVGIGPFAGMLALCLHSVSSLSKLYSEQIENISNGPIEAMSATGAHPIQVIWFGVVPQVILPYLSFTIYRWDINVRMATVIGLVGGGGIGTMLMQYQQQARWNEVGLLVIIIALIVWIMDSFSAKIREKVK